MPSRFLHTLEWTGETIFLAAVISFGLVAFLTVLGAFNPFASPITVLGGVATFAVWAGHRRWLRRHADEVFRAERPARERRGF